MAIDPARQVIIALASRLRTTRSTRDRLTKIATGDRWMRCNRRPANLASVMPEGVNLLSIEVLISLHNNASRATVETYTRSPYGARR